MLQPDTIDLSLEMLQGIYQLPETKRLEKIGTFIKSTFSITPDIYSPKNLKYLFSYPDPIGIYADFMATTLNSNIHTEECSPILTHCEVEVIKTLLSVVNYPAGDGVFYPGGSLSNLASVVLATQHKQINPAESVALVTNHSHYSIDQAVKICQIPNVLRVDMTHAGGIDLTHLAQQLETIQKNKLNLIYFCCVLGTTNFGTFDPLVEIQQLFKTYEMEPWIHFDAAWGGGVYFSQQTEYYQKFSEFSDSITLDFHKFLSAPLLCSALLVKDKTLLKNQQLSDNASYLFNAQQDQTYSLSLKSLQCSREAYAFKLWLMLHYHGLDYYREKIQHYQNNRLLLEKKLNRNVLFVVKPNYFNLCFWFIPDQLPHYSSIIDYSVEQQQQISDFNLKLYERIVADEFIQANYSHFNQLPVFIRIIVHHANLTATMIDEIADYLYITYDKLLQA